MKFLIILGLVVSGVRALTEKALENSIISSLSHDIEKLDLDEINCVEKCAKMKFFGQCRDTYYHQAEMSIEAPKSQCCCQWKLPTGVIDGKQSCLFVECPRDSPGQNPLIIAPQRDQLKLCLNDGTTCPIYSGHWNCPKQSGCNTKETKITDKKTTNEEMCNRIFWRETADCKNLCDLIFAPVADVHSWGYKSHSACKIGCNYGKAEVDWREQIAEKEGLWGSEEDHKNQKLQRWTSLNTPSKEIEKTSDWINNYKDKGCKPMCQKTVWNFAGGNTRCNWKFGLDINVQEVLDFGALKSCEIGCLLSMDPSAGALPSNYDAKFGLPK